MKPRIPPIPFEERKLVGVRTCFVRLSARDSFEGGFVKELLLPVQHNACALLSFRSTENLKKSQGKRSTYG
jgi:hypothetical protein